MKITKIGYGCARKTGKQTQEIYIEAELEDWEDIDLSLEVLRDKVAYELDLAYELVSLHKRIGDAINNLSAIQSEVARARSNWNLTRDFLIARGVDVDALGILPQDPIPF